MSASPLRAALDDATGGNKRRLDTTGANRDLAERAARAVRQHRRCSPERRAAAMAWAALVTTRTSGAARRALATFGDPAVRAAAAAILDDLERTP